MLGLTERRRGKNKEFSYCFFLSQSLRQQVRILDVMKTYHPRFWKWKWILEIPFKKFLKQHTFWLKPFIILIIIGWCVLIKDSWDQGSQVSPLWIVIIKWWVESYFWIHIIILWNVSYFWHGMDKEKQSLSSVFLFVVKCISWRCHLCISGWLSSSSGRCLIFGTARARGSNPASLHGTHGDAAKKETKQKLWKRIIIKI